MPYHDSISGMSSGMGGDPMSGGFSGAATGGDYGMGLSDPYAGYQAPQQPQQPQEPAAGGSWWMKVLSGALMGLGAGAGAPDAGTAFAQGSAAVMQQREKERQMILEQKKMEREQYLYEAQMAEHNLNKIKLQQDIMYRPQDEQQEWEKIAGDNLKDRDIISSYPVGTPEEAILKDIEGQGFSIGEIGHETYGGKTYIYKRDPASIFPEGTPPQQMPDGTIFNRAGVSRDEHEKRVTNWYNNQSDIRQAREANASRERASSITAQAGITEAGIRAQDQGNQTPFKPGYTTEYTDKEVARIDGDITRVLMEQSQLKLRMTDWDEDDDEYIRLQGLLTKSEKEERTLRSNRAITMKQNQELVDNYNNNLNQGQQKNVIPKLPIGSVDPNGNTVDSYTGTEMIIRMPNGQKVAINLSTGTKRFVQ